MEITCVTSFGQK